MAQDAADRKEKWFGSLLQGLKNRMSDSPDNHGVSAEEMFDTVQLRDAMRTVIKDLQVDDHDGYILEDCLFFVAILLERDIVVLSLIHHKGSDGRHFYLEAKVFEELEPRENVGEAQPTLLLMDGHFF